jgi:ribosomal protein S18 acetylase RimI-like enzyme
MYNPDQTFVVREARPSEYEEIGRMMVSVYSILEGFPKPAQQPSYYHMLAHVGALARQPETELWIAVSPGNQVIGTVVFFGDVKYSGAGGSSAMEQDAAGFRLLAVHPDFRGLGIGKQLTRFCIQRSRELGRRKLIIHSTEAMRPAWTLYESLGFRRSSDLDFMQGDLPVLGFRLILSL